MANLQYDNKVRLLNLTGITTATTAAQTAAVKVPADTCAIVFQGTLTVGSGGTDADMWVQMSCDGGTIWNDVCQMHFTTSTLTKVAAINTFVAHTHGTNSVAALADNSISNGWIGSQIRVHYVTTGTYGGTTNMTMDAVFKSLTTR